MPRRHFRRNVPIRIRKVQPSDIEAVVLIEREQFPVPWPKEYFFAELDNPIASFLVAVEETDGGIIGFMVFWMMDRDIELHQIAVSSGEKRRGVATKLLRFLLQSGRERRIESIHLEVRQSNAAAIRLYEKFGFRKSGQRKDYYQNPMEDACLFFLSLASPGPR